MSGITERQLPLAAATASGGCACCSPRPGGAAKPAPAAAGGQESGTYRVAGMTCGHCVSSVSEELRKLPGVQDVRIDLNPGGLSAVTLIGDRPVGAADVQAAVAEAGYELAGS